MSDYTPSVEALASAYVRIRRESDLEWGRYETTDQDRRAEFNRMIEAVRAEEREKAARIADEFSGLTSRKIARLIREQGS